MADNRVFEVDTQRLCPSQALETMSKMSLTLHFTHYGQGDFKMENPELSLTKGFKVTILILFIISLIVMGGCENKLKTLQSRIPKEKIPTDISLKVREQIEKLYSRNPNERAYGAHSLGIMGSEAIPAIPFLIGILNDYTEITETIPLSSLPQIKITTPSFAASISLANIYNRGKPKPSYRPLFEALKDKDPIIRRNIALLFGSLISDVQFVDPLIEALKDKDLLVRGSAAFSLREIGDARAIKPLKDALIASFNENANERILAEIYIALALLKDEETIEKLIEGLKKDKNSQRWKNSRLLLPEIAGEDFGENPEEWQKWWKKIKNREEIPVIRR